MTLGLIAAKENSNRFPNKNIHLVNGEPLFFHSVKPLLNSKLVDDVYVITNSKNIAKYCESKGVNIIWRAKNATKDEDKLISILRYAYYSLDIEYDIIVSIMANCPQNSLEDIEKGIKLMKKNNLKEVRSFDKNGLENGIMILDKEIIQDNRDISYYLGGIITNGKEIHYKEDLL
ncbi:MAG: hypothetical protein CMC82_10180 [Flavobacteriaceae bacterium]|nr:hypothetical protein [Flavobacteriaceae bacterium]|tara:strand:+ start:4434 stop:4958 length:525 start_codon:yes stop_codon:yes gene_type:complete